MSNKPAYWTDEEDSVLLSRLSDGETYHDIATAIGRTLDSVSHRAKKLRKQQASKHIAAIREVNLNPPIETNDKERIRELEAKLARMQRQYTYQAHSNPKEHTGGVLTVRESDAHHGDEGHLISCYTSCEAKVLTLIELYEPDRIQLIAMDDFIAGKGIFKEQDLSMAVSDVEGQMMIGAWKMRRKLLAMREVTSAPIKVNAMRGNHDFLGKTSLGMALFSMTALLCSDIPDVTFQHHGDRVTLNLADAGTYNVLAQHGYGHSKVSPNSPSFIDSIKDTLLAMQRNMQPEQQIRRVLSGHTHWLSIGMERQVGLFWDTTGGFQKNTRVQLGMNQRPCGVIVYVSPRGHDEILNPIAVKPDDDVQAREIADPTLAAANRADCAKSLDEYRDSMKSRGLVGAGETFGQPTEGRY